MDGRVVVFVLIVSALMGQSEADDQVKDQVFVAWVSLLSNI